MQLVLLTLLSSFVTLTGGDNINPTVLTVNGLVRGTSNRIDGQAIDTFYGIPYAQPPIGPLRFKPPKQVKSWSDVLDASAPRSICFQKGWFEDKNPQSEDCLFVNVHAPPKSGITKLLPVMVWVHGGCYLGGHGTEYDGRQLATKGVIVVTFNYRLNVLGFLSTEDNVMPGNYGMLDQVAVLKWVKDNIADFGGDPGRVTVFGESAGAGSVSLLVLSPLSKGLFRGAIMQSGSSLAMWSYAPKGRRISPRVATRLIGSRVGCNSTDSQTQLTCLQSIDVSLLVKATKQVADLFQGTDLIMNPRVETTYGFLPDLPIRLLSKGKFNHVNTIRGYNENESGYFIDFNKIPVSVGLFRELIAQGLRWFAMTKSAEAKILDDFMDMYISHLSNKSNAKSRAADAFQTDTTFRIPGIEETRMASDASKGEKHYHYMFGVRPEHSSQPEWLTAIHTDEIPFVFGWNYGTASPKQQAVKDAMMTLWTNFAKTGDPNKGGSKKAKDKSSLLSGIKWNPFDKKARDILVIRETSLKHEKYDDDSDKTKLILSYIRRINLMCKDLNCEPDKEPSTAARTSPLPWIWMPVLFCVLRSLNDCSVYVFMV